MTTPRLRIAIIGAAALVAASVGAFLATTGQEPVPAPVLALAAPASYAGPLRLKLPSGAPIAQLKYAQRVREALRRHNNKHVRMLVATVGKAQAIAWHRSWFRPRNAAITHAILALRPLAHPGKLPTLESGKALPWMAEKNRIRKLPDSAAELKGIDLATAFEGEAEVKELPDPIQNFTTYSIVPDPLVYTSVAAAQLTITDLPATVDEYVYDDKGVDHFGATFEHDFDSRVTANYNYGYYAPWAVSNFPDDGKGWLNASRQAIFCLRGTYLHTPFDFFLFNAESGGQDGPIAGIQDDWRYATAERLSETALDLRIYTDPGRGAGDLTDTLSVAIASVRRYRYVFGMNSYARGNPRTISGDVANLDLHEAPAGQPYQLRVPRREPSIFGRRR